MRTGIVTMIATRNKSRYWRWTNVPVPKSHIVGLIVGSILQQIESRRLPVAHHTAMIVGMGITGLSVLTIGWSVLALGRVDARDPEQLVDSGPYCFSRNPMYVAWTGLYVGLAVLFRSWWVLLLMPFITIAVHLTVRREETELAKSFGDSYRLYQKRVPRYF